MIKSFKKTSKQKEAIKLLASNARNVMLYGGSRSGKTVILLYAVIVRAAKVRSRHLCLRLRFNHIKTSIWLDTLPKVLQMCFPSLPIDYDNSDYYIKLPNGSEIWFAGLDDKQRTEKILGKEYSTIYFNECSQIPLESISIAVTRLAEKNMLKKKVFYDENPPSKRHWSYWMFIKHWHPKNEIELDKQKYQSLVMNPSDNLQNIDQDYITEVLSDLSEKDKERFMYGRFVDGDEGLAYYAFNREINVEPVGLRPGTTFIGMDFNVNPMTAVICQVFNDCLYVVDEVYLSNSDTPKMSHELIRLGYGGAKIIPDSTGRNRKTSGITDFQILKDAGFSIETTFNPPQVDRVNNVNRLLEHGRIIIDPKCKKLINDLEMVSWKDNKLDQKTDSMLTHISDALGYACWKLFPMGEAVKKISSQAR